MQVSRCEVSGGGSCRRIDSRSISNSDRQRWNDLLRFADLPSHDIFCNSWAGLDLLMERSVLCNCVHDPASLQDNHCA